MSRQRRRLVAAAALIAALALAAAPQPSPAAPDERSDPAAERALEQAEQAFEEPGRAGREATVALRNLALALPDLEGGDRRQARGYFGRPPERNEPPLGEPGANGNWQDEDATTDETCSLHFCAHWVVDDDLSQSRSDEIDTGDGADVNATPDYVDAALASAERSYAVENGELGWPEPKPDGVRGGTPQVDIYFSQLVFSNDFALFGYANVDPGDECLDDSPYRCPGYLVLDNDYAEFGYADPLLPLRVTMAHEYNHVLQFGIDLNQDGWMFESSATWSEEKVYPGIDDYLFYLPAFARFPGAPLTSRNGGQGLKVYASAVWNHWLDSRFGEETVRNAWTSSYRTRPPSFAVAAYDRAIRRGGGPGFAREFARFAATTAEWRDAPQFPDSRRYPRLVERSGSLQPGGRKRARIDNTAFKLYDVRRPGRGALRLRASIQRRTRAAIALVGRRPGRGPVVRLEQLPNGGSGSVRLGRAGRYKRVTVALINADAKARRKPAPRFAEKWRYLRDDRRFTARLR